jgi:hypothetical protein
MSSQVNPSSINAQFPVPGVNQPSQGFRSNFLAIQNAFAQYVTEMNDVINKAIVSAPLLYGANVSINNFGGMQNSNLALFDYALVTANVVASSANSVPALSFANSAVANIFITAASPLTQTITLTNFPALGYSEYDLIVQATTPPQFLSFASLTSGANIYGGSKISGYNSTTANLTISTSEPRYFTFGSADGKNWFIASPSHAIANSYTPTTAIGSPGDTKGKFAFDSSNIYICTNNYDGTTHVWKSVALTSY